eukprot:scaffold97555_cov15-Prasinocladus_malaysianus.AAC.1
MATTDKLTVETIRWRAVLEKVHHPIVKLWIDYSKPHPVLSGMGSESGQGCGRAGRHQVSTCADYSS